VSVVFASAACTTVPFANIVSVRDSQDALSVTATSADKRSVYVKIIDPRSYAVRQKIPIGRSGIGDVVAVLPDGPDLFVVTREGKGAATLYHVTPGVEVPMPAQKVGSLGAHTAAVVGMDADFLYVISTADRKDRGVLPQGMRFDRTLRAQRPDHFDENRSLVVVGIFEDAAYHWYVCVERRVVPAVTSLKELSGRLVLVRRSKDTKEFRQFDAPPDVVRNVQAVTNESALWIFATADPVKDVRQVVEPRIIKFSKADQTFTTHAMQKALIPFPHEGALKDSGVLWAMAGDKIVRLATGDMSLTPTALPKKFRTTTNMNRVPALYSTADDLIIGAYDQTAKTQSGTADFPVPYILRYSKADLTYEAIEVKPTRGEAFRTGGGNLCMGTYRGCCLDPMRAYERH
jgi:hypothetical protein